MSDVIRQLHLLNANGTARRATHDGRDYLVVPVVALMEGVIHAVNAATPEFVPAASLTHMANTWNGRPLVVGHPTKDGRQISANEPSILERQGFGFIANSRVNDKRLGVEAWCDVEKLKQLGQSKMLADLEAGTPVEVSVGAFVQAAAKQGVYNGKKYEAEWAAPIVPDHLAFLPGGRGACSIEMGCGAGRMAEAYLVTAEGFEEVEALSNPEGINQHLEGAPMTKRTLGERFAALVKGLKTAGIYDTPEEAASEEAAELVGYQTLRTHLDAIETAYNAASDLVDELIADETENPTQTPEQEKAEEEVETARLDSLISLLGGISYSAQTAISQCVNICMPDLPEPTSPRYMEELRAAVGKQISAKNMKTIQAAHDSSHDMHNHTTALGAECNGMKLLSTGSDATNEETQMTKEARAGLIKSLTECPCSGVTDPKMLETASDDLLTTLKAAADARSAENKTTEEKIAELKAASATAPKELTEEEFMKAAPASIKALIENKKAADAARTTELIEQLKTAQQAYTEAELKTLSLEVLEKLATVAKIEKPNFAGRGLVAVVNNGEAPNYTAPDPYEPALKAMRTARAN